VNKPINLLNITFTDQYGEMVVKEEYSVTFNDVSNAEKFIQQRHTYWQELLSMRLFMSPRQNETIDTIEIQKIFKLVSKHFNISPGNIFRRVRNPNVIEARRFGVAICTYLTLKPQTISDAIGFDRTNIIYHRNKFDGIYEVDIKYREKYERVKDAVLTELNGSYSEDVSGKKIG